MKAARSAAVNLHLAMTCHRRHHLHGLQDLVVAGEHLRVRRGFGHEVPEISHAVGLVLMVLLIHAAREWGCERI